MLRSILAGASGLLVWALVISVLNLALRAGIEGYGVAEHALNFTLGMMLARLAIAAASSVLAGAV
jgi:hypothetical protein